ncbi:MAG: leucine-rich repeat domain-containing protein [Verrucomicrobia bacterium]|nr:leucine-rich repeat domain-containing protein [Verrucomicrobiota bacterium]
MSCEFPWNGLSKELIVKILNYNVDPSYRQIDRLTNQLIVNFTYPDILKALFKELDPHPMRSPVSDHLYALLSPVPKGDAPSSDHEPLQPSSSALSELADEKTVITQQELNERCHDPVFVCSRIEAVFKELMHRTDGISDPRVRTECQQALEGLHCSVALQAMRHFENQSLITFVEALSNKLGGPFKERVTLILEAPLSEQDGTEQRAHAFRELLIQLQPEFERIQYLDLSNCKLTSLPPEIAIFKGLVILDLNRNKMTRLPHEIGELRNLARLTLSNNPISEIPLAIRQLAQLKELYIDSNKLEKIPAGVLALDGLEILNVNSNQITELPEALAQLKMLREFHAANNKITALPPSFGDLLALQAIDMRNNRIEALPESFKCLVNLQGLNLTKNKLAEYPAVLRFLPNLTDLKLDKTIADRGASISAVLQACVFAFGSAMAAIMQLP